MIFKCMMCDNEVEYIEYTSLCNDCESKNLARGNRMTKDELVRIQQQVKDGIPVLPDTWQRVLATALDALDEVEELDSLIQDWKQDNEGLQSRLASRGERP